MADDISIGQFTDLMETMRAGVESIARAQEKQALLTATGYAAGKRVAVIVNANNVVIQTRFTDDVSDLSYAELAAAITAAGQDAAAQILRHTRAMIEDLHAQTARLPKLSEFVPGLPDVREVLPARPEVSTAPPSARPSAAAEDADPPMVFTDVTPWDHIRSAGTQPGVSESSW
ncbi:YbaB/EbfC family nucleoid-associated protein [Nocardia sp. NBC_00565]|uniref:YbaB/EbfC family nucleoid-associated protein n=1 Tax=Nocardia sp. NBC_00565 TaxID=2975993 RepID=UPI002E80CC3E|nr:YbaB/EbfC family nucleoid-associated protein [Nocardia sp. NBC_00565]WUC02868.1 YbaB/EbfC family nucleoid-associated protein [Nocardia sp. NBC_00565]